jgi:NOL1/NOP2/sun family putative RNA methylase
MAVFLGNEYPAFAENLAHDPELGLRVNTLKLSVDEFHELTPFRLEKKIPWCPSAFFLMSPSAMMEEKLEPIRYGKYPYHMAGLFYLQEPSAMAVAQFLNPQPGEFILDLTASPGGKATHIASLMGSKGLLVANEIKTKRINQLMVNIERWGACNVIVTNETPERLADHFNGFFDRVVVDAPCSGEGMFRKDIRSRIDWSEHQVIGCSIRQTNILKVAARLVRPGGYLLYSTCTFAPEENEAVIDRFLQDHADFKVDPLPQIFGFMGGKPEWLTMISNTYSRQNSSNVFKENTPNDEEHRGNTSLQGAVRLFPHRLRGEGHFICLMQKKEGAKRKIPFPWLSPPIPKPEWKLWQDFQEEVLVVDFPADRLCKLGNRLYFIPENVPDLDGLRITIPGVWMGSFKKDRFEPAHPMALYLRPGQAYTETRFSANSEEIISYLKGETIPSKGNSGWTLVTVDGWPIGWGKRVQGLLKNHFPRGWQILS